MENQVFNKRSLVVFLITILVIVVIFWFCVPKMMPKNSSSNMVQLSEHPDDGNMETFACGAQVREEAIHPQEKDLMDKNLPFVNPKIGTIIDGPGFEKGEVEGVNQNTLSTIPSNYYFLDDGAGGEMSIQHNLCSKSCCAEQWPTPFKQKYDPYVCQNADKFVPSNIFCNNTFQDAGCLCLNKKQSLFLYNRGGNGREWF
jgi:hypothetical protein